MELAELDFLLRIDVDGRLEDDEEHLAVAFDLGPLIRMVEIVDEDGVEIPRRGDFCQKLRSGVGDDHLGDRP